MKFIPFSISAIVTILLVWALNKPWGSIPALGAFFSPQQGFWQNAESTDNPGSISINDPFIKGSVEVYLDDRLVPHVFAENESDLFFAQGYLHAKYRLWQMEFQTHAAGGRLSEILGPGKDSILLLNDRQMRRLGMVYGAKKALAEMEAEPKTKITCDAYTAGVNAYIHSLSSASLPLEYKLLGYQPEEWTNLKTALFLKYMSYDLSGSENDFEFTNVKSVFDQHAFELLFPITRDSLDPIVAKGTPFDSAKVKVLMPVTADSLYFQWKPVVPETVSKPDQDNGSNNWAVAGTKTASGRPILCNDPHLSLNMPSLWFEIQLTCPQFSAYGASFPGAPCVIIGFNQNNAFGFTNAMRDVRDYYTVKFKDESRKEYWFNNSWQPSRITVDTFMIKGGGYYFDTVVYTNIGPVMYDQNFTGREKYRTNGSNYAVKWKAHEPSNELMLFYELDHSTNYSDYQSAIKYLSCPGQNCLFASKAGDIAVWQQAVFPAKWRRQGDFVMPGTDSSYFWQADIPQDENAHMVNPSRGYVSSANQLPVDTTYPYYIGGHHDLYRGKLINRKLEQMSSITIKDMQGLQNENENLFAETAMPVLLKNIDETQLTSSEKELFNIVKTWNKRNDPNEQGVAVFHSWFDSLETTIWSDEFAKVPQPYITPDESTLIEALIRDSAFQFIDDISTPEKETLAQQVLKAFKKAVPELMIAKKEGRLVWYKFKDSGIQHLTRVGPLSRLHLKTGGGVHVINATKQFHGPSWKMIVELTDKIRATGIYPGGQSGNPGSKFYDNFVDTWASGGYYDLWFMTKDEIKDKRILSTITFKK